MDRKVNEYAEWTASDAYSAIDNCSCIMAVQADQILSNYFSLMQQQPKNVLRI